MESFQSEGGESVSKSRLKTKERMIAKEWCAVSLSMPVELHDHIVSKAKENFITKAEYVRTLIIRDFKGAKA